MTIRAAPDEPEPVRCRLIYDRVLELNCRRQAARSSRMRRLASLSRAFASRSCCFRSRFLRMTRDIDHLSFEFIVVYG